MVRETPPEVTTYLWNHGTWSKKNIFKLNESMDLVDVDFEANFSKINIAPEQMTAKVLFLGGMIPFEWLSCWRCVPFWDDALWHLKQNLDMCWVLPLTLIDLIVKVKHWFPSLKHEQIMTNPLSSQGRKTTPKIVVEVFFAKGNVLPHGWEAQTRRCSFGHLWHLTHQSVFFFVSPHLVKDWLVKQLGNPTEPPPTTKAKKSRAWLMDY